MAQPMELVVNTEVSPGTTITLPIYGVTSVKINYGDGNEETISTGGDIEHTYDAEGTYIVTISGSFTRYGKIWDIYDNADKLIRVNSFGEVGLTSLAGAFRNAVNLIEVPQEIPSTVTLAQFMFYNAASFNQDLSWDVSNITDMNAMFRDAASFNGNISDWNVENVTTMSGMFGYATSFNGDIGGWNVSNVTDMYSLFYEASSFNQDISGWDVSNVNNMGFMFRSCTAFNQDIGAWDVGEVTNMDALFSFVENFNQDLGGWNVENVTSMSNMFRGSAFNHDIGDWDVSNVEDMSFMFSEADEFNQDISSWDVSNVTSMKWMFRYARSFNQDIGNWDVNMVEDMSYMFYHAESFNQDIGNWDVGKVKDMSNMFYNAIAFNQDIGKWNVGSVETMEHMFQKASSFNQDISGWNVGNVTSMQSMFHFAVSFNQDIGSWNMSSVSDVTGMLSATNISTAFYNKLLIGWAGQSLQNDLLFHGGNDNKYSPGNAADARQKIINDFNWDIYDGGTSDLPAVITDKVSEVQGTTAISGGEVMADGGYTVTQTGVVWNTSENPTLTDNEGFTEDEFIQGTNEFISELTSLSPLTTYYIRSYAKNSQGTEYGNTMSFTSTKQELSITGSFTVLDKEFNGTIDAVINENNLSLEGVLGSDNVELGSVVAAFETNESGENILVTIVDATLEGTDIGNYFLSLQGSPTTVAAINPKEIFIDGTFTVLDKEYDGTTDADIDENNLVPDGIIASDDVELASVAAAFETPESGENILVTIVDATLEGTDIGNYFLSLQGSPTTVADIIPPVNINRNYINNITIYPNPSSGYLFLKNTDDVLYLKVLNNAGKVILTKDINGKTMINICEYSNGLYFLEITFNNKEKEIFKFIKN